MKKSMLYTRTGDNGSTSLVGGKRVKKNDIRLEAYGTVDELNSNIGLLTASTDLNTEIHQTLLFIQNKLFNIGAYLATDNPENSITECVGLGHEAISRIEHEIDTLDNEVPPMTNFVLPGGSQLSAIAHIARTVCRRCERRIISLSDETYVDPNVVRFINRLSDYLFVFARFNNISRQIDEIFWNKDC